MAGSPPNLHTMDSRSACIQDLLKVKVKGHVIRALLCWHENHFFSQANGRIATKFAHDGLRVSVHPECGQGQRSHDTRTFLDSWNELLRHCRSGLLFTFQLYMSIDTSFSLISCVKVLRFDFKLFPSTKCNSFVYRGRINIVAVSTASNRRL